MRLLTCTVCLQPLNLSDRFRGKYNRHRSCALDVKSVQSSFAGDSKVINYNFIFVSPNLFKY